MHTTYHFKSVADIDMNVLESIKTAFKGKAVMLTVEEEESDFYISNEQKEFVLNSIKVHKKNPSLLIGEEEAWKIINTD
jgi:hypothetical protein